MKKIVMGIAAIACAASMFAVDVSTKVQMKADIARKAEAGDDVEFFSVNTNNQKDADALIFAVNGEKAGAQWQAWYTFDGTNGENFYNDKTKKEAGTSKGDWEDNNLAAAHGLRIRNVSLWFKPLDMLKVTVGNIAVDSYKEMIFWWHGVYGEKPGSWGGFGGEYLGGVGVKSELTPVANLDLTFAFMPGIDTPWISTKKDSKVTNFALKAKYSNIADMPISAAVVYANKNGGDTQIIGVGADYGSPWSGNFYAFLNVNMNLTKNDLTAISFDNYEKYTKDALVVAAHLPVSLYKSGDKFLVGMHASVKATYALDGFTPYLLISNEPDGDAGWLFDDFKFNMTFNPGVTFNVGTCGMDIGVRVDVADSKLSNWKVPATMTVAF